MLTVRKVLKIAVLFCSIWRIINDRINDTELESNML